MTQTEYIITARVKTGSPCQCEVCTGHEQFDWKVCITYEAAQSWLKWFQDRYRFVYLRECSEPLNVAPNPAQCRSVDLDRVGRS
jgi:hypothetical protein